MRTANTCANVYLTIIVMYRINTGHFVIICVVAAGSQEILLHNCQNTHFGNDICRMQEYNFVKD